MRAVRSHAEFPASYCEFCCRCISDKWHQATPAFERRISGACRRCAQVLSGAQETRGAFLMDRVDCRRRVDSVGIERLAFFRHGFETATRFFSYVCERSGRSESGGKPKLGPNVNANVNANANA